MQINNSNKIDRKLDQIDKVNPDKTLLNVETTAKSAFLLGGVAIADKFVKSRAVKAEMKDNTMITKGLATDIVESDTLERITRGKAKINEIIKNITNEIKKTANALPGAKKVSNFVKAQFGKVSDFVKAQTAKISTKTTEFLSKHAKTNFVAEFVKKQAGNVGKFVKKVASKPLNFALGLPKPLKIFATVAASAIAVDHIRTSAKIDGASDTLKTMARMQVLNSASKDV